MTIPRKGAQVAKMTEKDLQDVLEVRDALDELAVISACAHITEEQLQELKRTVKDFELAIRSKDVRRMVGADEAFHNVIYRAADNPKLENIVKNLREQMYRYRYEYIKDHTNYHQLVSEHAAMIEGFEKKDVSYVRKIMHTHLENQIEAVRAVIREQE